MAGDAGVDAAWCAEDERASSVWGCVFSPCACHHHVRTAGSTGHDNCLHLLKSTLKLMPCWTPDSLCAIVVQYATNRFAERAITLHHG